VQDVHVEERRELLDVSVSFRGGREEAGDAFTLTGGEPCRVGGDGSLVVQLPPNTIRVLLEQPGRAKAPARSRANSSTATLVE
jgi:organic radical activating enzyme